MRCRLLPTLPRRAAGEQHIQYIVLLTRDPNLSDSCRFKRGTSQVLRLSTGFPYNVLSLSISLENPGCKASQQSVDEQNEWNAVIAPRYFTSITIKKWFLLQTTVLKHKSWFAHAAAFVAAGRVYLFKGPGAQIEVIHVPTAPADSMDVSVSCQ
jgi:hypothetical protein